MSKKPKIALMVNNAITNDPCALCGSRCSPCGLDYTLRSERARKYQALDFSGLLGCSKRALVCDACAEKYAPDVIAARKQALLFHERELHLLSEQNRSRIAELEKLRELTVHLLSAIKLMESPTRLPADELPF